MNGINNIFPIKSINNHYSLKYPRLDERTRKIYDRILRVNHAGELGADRIYAGQLFILQNTSVAPTIKHMWEQEKQHLQTFEHLIQKYNTRPSFLVPLWSLAGFALGAGSALLGKRTAMACTVAVETVISDHYNNQIRELLHLKKDESVSTNDKDSSMNQYTQNVDNSESYKDDSKSWNNATEEKDEELIKIIQKFRDEEIEHHDTGLEHEALQAPFAKPIVEAIKFGCKAAIFVAQRI